jgi:uncharacterized protein with von Willebrand factor type A (vWA) domain
LHVLKPGRRNEEELFAWCVNFFSGGSNLDVPIRELPEYYKRMNAPTGKTDIVLITDAACHLPPAVADEFVAWKKSVGASVVGIILGGSAGDLASVCDEVFERAQLDTCSTEVERVLSS